MLRQSHFEQRSPQSTTVTRNCKREGQNPSPSRLLQTAVRFAHLTWFSPRLFFSGALSGAGAASFIGSAAF